MNKDHVTIQEAADLSKKSIQTIRRAIKSKKIKIKKQKTPQGFNYLLDRASFCDFFGIRNTEKFTQGEKKDANIKAKTTKSFVKIDDENHTQDFHITADDFKKFTQTLERMVNQHSEERQNFLRLMNTLQEKIFVLENQLNLLKAPQKKWYSFWR
ncbi:hypothetical protein HZC20_00555 [Candidatus Peregrinibacteria bacterium]|nr:hypothetical protein [Candidatus Peregrinibacteria bacterium]